MRQFIFHAMRPARKLLKKSISATKRLLGRLEDSYTALCRRMEPFGLDLESFFKASSAVGPWGDSGHRTSNTTGKILVGM
jgi:hypothetical protein